MFGTHFCTFPLHFDNEKEGNFETRTRTSIFCYSFSLHFKLLKIITNNFQNDDLLTLFQADEIEINEEPKAQLQIAPASSNNKKQKKKEKENNFKERTITVNGKPHPTSFSPNVIRNQKYNIVTFVPYTLWEQFKYFINFVCSFHYFSTLILLIII